MGDRKHLRLYPIECVSRLRMYNLEVLQPCLFETLEGAIRTKKIAENRISSSVVTSGFIQQTVVSPILKHSQNILEHEPAQKLKKDGLPKPYSNDKPPPAQPVLPQMTTLEIAIDYMRATPTPRGHKSRTRITMNRQSFQRLDCVGKGGSARIYRVMIDDFRILALKKVSLRGVDEVGVRGFKGEIEFLKKLIGMDRVVKLIDWEFNVSIDCLNLVCT